MGTPHPRTFSDEVFTIPMEPNRYLVYAPLRRCAFVANGRMVNILASLKCGQPLAVTEENESVFAFLERLHLIGDYEDQWTPTRSHGLPKPTSVTLFLTTACNLRCTYCYASAGDAPVKSMSLETARRGIDFVAANAVESNERTFKVGYHGGGEPTANWRVLTSSCDYAKEKASTLGLSFTASSASNGILTDSQIDWIISNLHGVSLSFDGLPHVHDKCRVTASGRGSSNRVIHTMKRFDEAEFPYGIRITVTREAIAHLPDSIDYIARNFNPSRVQVEPAYQLGRGLLAPSAETQEFIEHYRLSLLRARAYDLELSFSAARLDVLTSHFCTATQDSFSLSADGNVTACYEVFSEDSPFADIFFYGTPSEEEQGYSFDLTRLESLRNESVETRQFCQRCFAKWHCAGDCYHKLLAVNGRTEFAGSDRCHITRELTKDQILEKISESGGLFWQGSDARLGAHGTLTEETNHG